MLIWSVWLRENVTMRDKEWKREALGHGVQSMIKLTEGQDEFCFKLLKLLNLNKVNLNHDGVWKTDLNKNGTII